MRIYKIKYSLEVETLHNTICIDFQIIRSVAKCLYKKCTGIFNRILKNVRDIFGFKRTINC